MVKQDPDGYAAARDFGVVGLTGTSALALPEPGLAVHRMPLQIESLMLRAERGNRFRFRGRK